MRCRTLCKCVCSRRGRCIMVQHRPRRCDLVASSDMDTAAAVALIQLPSTVLCRMLHLMIPSGSSECDQKWRQWRQWRCSGRCSSLSCRGRRHVHSNFRPLLSDISNDYDNSSVASMATGVITVSGVCRQGPLELVQSPYRHHYGHTNCRHVHRGGIHLRQ